MPSCPHCRAESTTARSCYGDQICVVCLNQCTQFGVLECGHLICIDCTRRMGFDIVGSAVKQSWELERSRDGVTGKVTHIRNPVTGRLVSIKGPSGREALALEEEQKQAFLAKERKKFLQENRARSSSPPAARTVHQPTRSLSPIRDEAQMVEPDTVILLPWDATYAAAFNRGVRERNVDYTLEIAQQAAASENIHTRSSRKTRINAVGSTTESSESGFGLFKCPECGKRVMRDGELCDNCDDVKVEPPDVEEPDNVTEEEILAIQMDTTTLG